MRRWWGKDEGDEGWGRVFDGQVGCRDVYGKGDGELCVGMRIDSSHPPDLGRNPLVLKLSRMPFIRAPEMSRATFTSSALSRFRPAPSATYSNTPHRRSTPHATTLRRSIHAHPLSTPTPISTATSTHPTPTRTQHSLWPHVYQLNLVLHIHIRAPMADFDAPPELADPNHRLLVLIVHRERRILHAARRGGGDSRGERVKRAESERRAGFGDYIVTRVGAGDGGVG